MARICSASGRRRDRRWLVARTPASLVLSAGCALGAGALADENPVTLQWFETRWETIEYRTADLFVAGYDSVWIPPTGKASDPTSVGYDAFDRFDLGRPGSPTAYGTEEYLRAMIAELHRANVAVYADAVLNHNSARTSNAQFIGDGGWPGFVMNRPGDFWGDFHDGTQQSHDPGGPNYNLFNGDLVGLIDIAQEENYQYIRHPVEDGNALNIPPGNIRNRPDPANRRFYPDQQLTPLVFVNPATGTQWTVYPFNAADPGAGDPYADNASGLLMRWTQWMVDDIGVDGFRLDAVKHVPQWFWNNLWDVAVFHRRVTPSGAIVTPFSFGEAVADNGFIQTYIRKDGFGYRDALDINGAGALRNIRSARGFASWNDALTAHLDNQDNGVNDGTQGVNHVYSHDNGTTDGTPPPVPGPELYALPEHAYTLFKPGLSVVYHNSREFAAIYTNRGFWPDEGNPTALGAGSDDLARLVRLSNGYARGGFYPINNTDPVNQSNADVMVYERRTRRGDGSFVGNVLVATNDRYDSGYQVRNVQTTFAPGTRLHELTGNHIDPVVDSGTSIPELLTVDGNRRVTMIIPSNKNTLNVEHHKGYVVYGPAAPSGTLSIIGASSVLGPDPASVPAYKRRLTGVDVVTGPSFTISLSTTKTDPSDPDWDDNAVFRIDDGFVDSNGNGGVDIGDDNATVPGYEQFLSFHRSIVSDPSQNGLYQQTIATDSLEEGYHYVSVVAFRRRSDGGQPIYTEFRKVIYVDREGPAVELLDQPISVTTANPQFRVRAADRTAVTVHLILDVPAGTDPLTVASDSNRATRYDRLEWRRTFDNILPGNHSLSVVAFETTGRASVTTYEFFTALGSGDLNGDGLKTIDDLYELAALTAYRPEGDMNRDGAVNAVDLRILEGQLRGPEADRMAEPQR